jgi:hypothetical protein
VLYPQMANTGGLHRENLKLDGYDLAIGYDPGEKRAVAEYLLGRPWMELVQRDYLLETSPNFYRISEDGVAALNNTTIRLITLFQSLPIWCMKELFSTTRTGSRNRRTTWQ